MDQLNQLLGSLPSVPLSYAVFGFVALCVVYEWYRNAYGEPSGGLHLGGANKGAVAERRRLPGVFEKPAGKGSGPKPAAGGLRQRKGGARPAGKQKGTPALKQEKAPGATWAFLKLELDAAVVEASKGAEVCSGLAGKARTAAVVVEGLETTFTLTFLGPAVDGCKGQLLVDIGGVKTFKTDVDTATGCELHVSKMAVCVGEMCVPIPKSAKKILAPAAKRAAKSQPAPSKKDPVPASDWVVPQASPAPAGSAALQKLFGASLVDRRGGTVSTGEALRDCDAIGIYFSAHWCPPCRQFTPYLASTYLELKKRKRFEIVFASSDKGPDEFESYLNEMPWLAVPYHERGIKEVLSKVYGVRGIPALVIINGNGDLISKDGRTLVSQDPRGTTWLPEPPKRRPPPPPKAVAAASKQERPTPAAPCTTTLKTVRVDSGGDLKRAEVGPLKDLSAVNAWTSEFDTGENVAAVPLRPRRTREKKESKLLVCHDMMGGYTPQDKWPQGNMEEADLFRIYDWHLIDVFVYFSHNLVTIPPSPWTNCAHRNGTKCLGTFIAEWDEGVERCARIFESVATARRFADKLVAIASYYRFDGWLVNIENGLGRAQVAVLKAFLEHLTAQIHAAIPGSEVIWYDGVNKDGVVQHQNMLNSLNQPFFDLTDGIFLNYWYTPDMVQRSRMNAKLRQTDVYVGIDVFGRDTYGGGGMACDKACEVILQAGVSTALFAPGWIFEDERFKGADFDETSARFWKQMRGHAGMSVQGLPFESSFGAGRGMMFAVEGEVTGSHPWCNLNEVGIHANIPPYSQINPYFLGPRAHAGCLPQSFTLDYSYAYQGGNSLAFVGDQPITAAAVAPGGQRPAAVCRLFATDIPLKSPVCISFTYLQFTPNVEPKLMLHCGGEGGPATRYLVLSTAATAAAADGPESVTSQKLWERYKLKPSAVAATAEDRTVYSQSTHAGHFGRGGERSTEAWKTATFVVADAELKSRSITEVRLVLELAAGATLGTVVQFYLGEIKMARASSFGKLPDPVSKIELSHARWHKPVDQGWSFSAVLSWGTESLGPQFSHADVWAVVDGATSFVGRTRTSSCRVHRVGVPAKAKSARLYVQPVSTALFKAPLEACSSVSVSW